MTASAPQSPPSANHIDLKPRKKLFWGLLIFFFLWMAVLLVLYFKTVRGNHPFPTTQGVALAPTHLTFA